MQILALLQYNNSIHSPCFQIQRYYHVPHIHRSSRRTVLSHLEELCFLPLFVQALRPVQSKKPPPLTCAKGVAAVLNPLHTFPTLAS